MEAGSRARSTLLRIQRVVGSVLVQHSLAEAPGIELAPGIPILSKASGNPVAPPRAATYPL